MSNKKQSSIQWLENQLKEKYSLMNSEPLFEQAKAMHKSEIVKASAQGHLIGVEEGFPLETAYNYAHQWYNNQFAEDKDE